MRTLPDLMPLIRLQRAPDSTLALDETLHQQLTGTSGEDRIWGLDGDDILIGRADNDILIGGDGFDFVIGDAMDPVVRQGRGFTDTFMAERGEGTLSSGSAPDVPRIAFEWALDGRLLPWIEERFQDPDADIMVGGAGTDIFEGGAGGDAVFAGPGNDWIIASEGADIITGGDGVDTVVMLWSGAATLTVDLEQGLWEGGGSEEDTFYSVEGVIGSLEGANDLRGDAADNQLFGVYGDDTLIGRGGNDILAGNDGSDFIDGGDGDDWLSGDFLMFRFDTHTLFTGSRYSADHGADTLVGGAGADLFFVMTESGNDMIADFAPGEDRIAVAQRDEFSTPEEVLAQAVQVGADVEIALSENTTLTLQDTDLGTLTADDVVLFDGTTWWLPNEEADALL